MHDDAGASVWFGPAVFALFVVMWPLVSHLLAAIGGWRQLASTYRATEAPYGESFTFRSAKLGMVDYSSCLRFVAGPKGLFIATLFPFRVAHPPLFVPWTDVSAATGRFLVFRYADLRFKQQPQVRMRLSHGLAEKLLAASGGTARISEAA